MNRQELISLLFSNLEAITLVQAVVNLLIALVCAVIVYTVYYLTSKDVKPTAAFAKTILIVTLSVALMVMLIGSNLALSLGMVGALSIIRFRAAVKDSRDAAFIFFAIAVGMTSAVGIYLFAILGSLFIGAAILLFSFIKIGAYTYLITVKSEKPTSQVVNNLKESVGRHYRIMSSSIMKKDDCMIAETVYEVGIKGDVDSLCQSISKINEVISVTAVKREEI